jgi:leader peptidase (prepilin peptidase)/N-methyltransferase
LYALIIFSLFVIGLCVGSFLNVVIVRFPKKESIVTPPSHCPYCNNRIAVYDNIPLLSFLLLRGRCRNCKKRISFQYPTIELIAGIVLPLTLYLFGFGLKFFQTFIFLYLLIPLFMIDLRHRLVPDKITIPGIVIGFGFSFFLPDMEWYTSLIGIVVGGLILLIVSLVGKWVFKKEAMGMGDVLIFMLVGAFVGWRGVILTLLIASLLGSIIGSIVVMRRQKKDTTIPFGPFITVASVITFFFGDYLIGKYLSLLR